MNFSTFYSLVLLAVWSRCEGTVLECYQCESLSNETLPLCDVDFWHLTTPSERYQMVTICPKRRSDFCMKLVVWYGTVSKTTRGCFTAQDRRGVRLRVGCSNSIDDGDGGLVCMCSTHRCNGVAAKPGTILTSVYLTGLVLLDQRFRMPHVNSR